MREQAAVGQGVRAVLIGDLAAHRCFFASEDLRSRRVIGHQDHEGEQAGANELVVKFFKEVVVLCQSAKVETEFNPYSAAPPQCH